MKTGSRGPIPKHYKIITWLNIITQISFPLACTFTPIMAMSSNSDNSKLLPNTAPLNYRQTQTYILKEGENTATVAKQYNMSVDALRKLNQFRTFAHAFEQLKPGDELDIPMAPLPTIQWDDKKQPQPTAKSTPEEMKLAQFTSQAGKFLANKPSVDSAEKLARNIAMSTASDSIQQWLNRTGNAQVRLEADKKFSLSHSQVNLLHPIYETKEKLIFTQGSLHRTDGRLQTNLGMGVRWFGDKQMFGGNTFFDYDISRGHTRLGLGAEYRRDYLNVSANSYHPLTHWKSSKDLTDHTERPAHGWDIRAEGWLPSYPHLGGKLVYEQYYGDHVALFNRNNLQRNPQAMTAGVNYTPFPLLTLSAEHRQGKSNQQDSRIGLNINYYLGKTWKQHVDSDAVSKLRSLVGSRYDFVNRNNNIILQYQRNEVINLSFSDTIIGFAGEKKPLPFNVNSKYGLDHIKWSAPQVVAAGGQIIDEKNGKYSIIMPEYKFGAKAINQYFINAVAVDKKNNVSPNATLQLIVNQPKVDISSTTFTPTNITLVADGKASQTLTLLVKDKQGNPIDVSSNEIHVEKTARIKRAKHSAPIAEARALKASPSKRKRKDKTADISVFTRVAPGKYTAILSASQQSESFNLTPIVRDTRLSPIQITIVADQSTLQLTPPTLNTTQPQVANGKQPVEITIQLVDANNNPLANTEITWQSDKKTSEVTFKNNTTLTDQNGFATAIVESTVAGDVHITASANGAASQGITLNFISDKTTSTVAPNNIHVTNSQTVANGHTPNPIEITVTDAHGNPVPNVDVQFSTDKGQLTANTVKTDSNGVAKTQITSTAAGTATVTINVEGKETTQTIEFISDKTTSTVAPNNIHVTNSQTVANGHTPNPIEITVTDAHGNPVPNVDVQFSTDKGQLTANTVKTDSNGVAKTQITSTVAGTATVTISVDGKETTQAIEFISDKTTSTVEPNNIHVSNSQTVANGHTPNPIEITVTDAHGNPVPNVDVQFSTDKGQLTANTVKTDSNGVAKTQITSTAAGTATVTISVEGKETTQAIEFISDKTTSTVAPNNIHVSNSQTVANGHTPNPIEITVTDAHGNPVPNVDVQFSTDKGQLTDNTVKTDSNGVAKTEITSTVAGTATVTISVDGKETTQAIEFISDKTTSTVEPNNIHVSNSQTVANGHTPNPIEITVTDAHGNPVPNVDVQFSTDKGQLTANTVKTDSNGVAKTEITSTAAGTATVTINVEGKETTQAIEFISDKTTSTVEPNNIHVSNSQTVANGHTPNPIEITVTDAHGNPVPNVDVQFSTDKGQLTANTVKTDSNGVAKTEITSTAAGTATVTISVDGKETTQAIEFISDKTTSTVAPNNIHVSNSQTVANGHTPNPIEITVTDAHGNPVPNVDVQFSTDKGQLTANTVKTDSNGVAKTEITSTAAGTATVTISVDGKETTQAIEFISDKTTPQMMTPTLNTTQPQVANGKQPFEVKTQVIDANGNPIANAEVKWSSNKNLNEVSFSELTTLTNKDGYATTQVTSTIADNVIISATTDNATPQDITVQFVPDNTTATIKPADLIISHTSSIADGSTPNTIEVTVTDAQGNKVPNIDVTFATNLGDLVAPTVTTDANGVAKTQLTSTKTGDATVTVTVGGNHFDKIISFVANQQTAKVDSVAAEVKNQYLADGKTTVTYTAKVVDANQNPVVNGDVDWSSDIADVVFNQSTSKTDDKGVATVIVTSTKAKPTVITATTNNHSLSASSITFVADSTQAQITAFNINKSILIANQTDTAIVETLITDNYGNPLENIAVTLTSNRGGDDNLTARTPLFRTDTKGYVKAEVNTAKAGDIILSAEIANRSKAKSVTLKAIADNTTASISINASQKTVQINANATKIRLTATVKDAHNNPLANTPVAWLSNHNQLSTHTTQTNSRGQAQVELSGYTSGNTKVTAQLLNNATEETTIQFMAGAAKAQNSILAIKPQTIVANGQEQATATFELKDQWDNPVTGKTVQWDNNNSAITISDIRELTGNKGIYQAKISGTRAGTFELTATSDTISKKINIGLIADTSNSTIDSINITSQAAVPANGVAQITVQATVTDTLGNPAANVPVGWKTEIGELNQLISSTDYRGIAQVTLSSSVAGKGKVSAILGSSTKATASEITFLAGSVSTSASTATLTTPSISAAVGKTEIIVSLKDDTGNRLWGLSDKITLDYSTDLGLNKAPRFTESQTAVGTYHAELSGTKAGKTNIRVYVDGVKLDNDIAFTVTPNSQTAKVRGDIVPVKLREVVGNHVTYTATFEDANANLLGAGVPVFWTANDGTKLSTPQTTTDNNGQSSITVKREVVGNAEITVNLTSQNSKTAPSVHFEQGGIDVSKTTLELTPSTIVAGDSSRLNIVLRDKFGNLLTRQSAAIDVKSRNNHISIGSVTEAALLPGNYQVAVTSNKAGTGELLIKLNGAAITQTKTLQTIGDKTHWHIASLVSDTKTIKAGDSTGVTYKATVMDRHQNPLPDVNVSWHLQGKAEPFPHSSTTNAQGVAEIKLTSLNAGELIMNAVLSDKVEKKADAVQVVANDIDPQLSTFTSNKTDIGPDNQEEVLLTIKLQDSFGNPVLKQAIDIKSNAAARDFIISQVTEQQDGQYTAKATAANSAAGKGPVKLTAKVGNRMIAQPIEIKIDAITPVLRFSDNVKSLTYSSRTHAGQAIEGLPRGFTPRWSSDNTSIVTVNDQGELQLKKAGHTKIWARIDGNGTYKSAEVSYELNVAKAKPELKLTSRKTVKATWDDGSKPKIEPVFDNSDATALPVEFVSNTPEVAQINFRTGEISQVKPGKAKLVVNTKETDRFLADSQEVTYELAKARFNIHFAHSEQEYTDEKAHFNLQQARAAVPAKAEAKWRSSDNSIVNIDSNGTINRLGKGKAQLTLAIKNNDYYQDSEGAYTTKIYAKPSLPPISVVYRNNGKEERGGSQWLPVYTDDSMKVVIPPIQSTEYDKPSRVEVSIKSGSNIVETRTLQDWNVATTITVEPKPAYYKQKLMVEVTAKGRANLGLEAKTHHDSSVEYTDPNSIGTIQTDYQPRYIVTDDDVDDKRNECARFWTDWDRHFMIQPITKVDLGNKQLLIPLTIHHSVEKVSNKVDTFSFDNQYQVTKSDRYKFSSTARKYSVMSACWRDHYGTGKLQTHLKFGDKSATNEMEFYWEGMNRYPHKPQI